MTQPRDDDRIAHIVEAAEQAIAFTHGRTRADLDDDRMLQLALTKLVEVVGEAAKAITEQTRAGYPEVPWSVAARTRDRRRTAQRGRRACRHRRRSDRPG